MLVRLELVPVVSVAGSSTWGPRDGSSPVCCSGLWLFLSGLSPGEGFVFDLTLLRC
jgi:hypothetical protein